MVKDKEIKVRLETIPTHKFIYLETNGVDNYMDFWQKLDDEGHDCDQLHGYLESIPGQFKEGFGGFTKQGYLFGTDAPIDYEVPDELGFNETLIEAKEYLIFEHPGFKEAEFEQALKQVRKIALDDFDFELHGYERDDSLVKAYEHSGMELCYYFIRIPLKSKQ